jgi:hypothetical protein
MYEGCCNGDPTFARQMVANADQAVAFNSQFPVHIQTTEHDEEDDVDMTDSQNKPQLVPALPAAPVDYTDQPLFGQAKKSHVPTGPQRQLGESAPDNPTLEMDEDGFAPVKPKGRRIT